MWGRPEGPLLATGKERGEVKKGKKMDRPCVCTLSCFTCVQFFATLWTVARQAPLSMGILQARILEWLPFLSPGDPLNPEIQHASFVSPALAGRFFTTSITWEAPNSRGGHPSKKEGIFADTLILTQWDSFQTSDLQKCRRIHLNCFTPLSLGSFVTAATKS